MRNAPAHALRTNSGARPRGRGWAEPCNLFESEVSIIAGVAGAGLSVVGADRALARDDESPDALTKGDAALLRFAAAAEILESDFWIQYNELGGIQDAEVPDGFGNPAYTAKLALSDEDFAQYIHDNTDDEITQDRKSGA